MSVSKDKETLRLSSCELTFKMRPVSCRLWYRGTFSIFLDASALNGTTLCDSCQMPSVLSFATYPHPLLLLLKRSNNEVVSFYFDVRPYMDLSTLRTPLRICCSKGCMQPKQPNITALSCQW